MINIIFFTIYNIRAMGRCCCAISAFLFFIFQFLKKMKKINIKNGMKPNKSAVEYLIQSTEDDNQ
jgi:hypothetical protein